MQLVLSYYAYSKHCFWKIYVSVILQLSGMKLAINNHSTEKKTIQVFVLNTIGHTSKLRRWKNVIFILGYPHTYCKTLLPCLAFKITMILYTQSLRYSSLLFTILFFKYKCLRIISCERQLFYAYNEKTNIHKIISLLIEKSFHLNKNNV